MSENKTAKTITTGSLILMIITSVYGFGNVSVSYFQMGYASIIWYIFAGIVFMIPSSLMMAEYSSAYPDAKGGFLPGSPIPSVKSGPLLGPSFGSPTG